MRANDQLVSGDEDKMWNIRSEILAVLQDQVNEGTTSSADKKLLSAQVKSPVKELQGVHWSTHSPGRFHAAGPP